MEEKTNKFHALQLFTDTFTAETVHLTNEQVGIYIKLLCFSWTKTPNLLKQNQHIESVNAKLKNVKKKLIKFY